MRRTWYDEKKVVSLLLVMVMSTMMFNLQGRASNNEEISDLVEAKRELVAAHSDNYIEGYSETAEGQERSNYVTQLINKMQAGVVDEAEAKAALEALGVYKLEVESAENNVNLRASQSGDVPLNNVTTFYDSTANEWYLAGGGTWGTGWLNDVPLISLPIVGSMHNIGGNDGVGIKIYNTSGTYNTYVKRSQLYYSDGTNDYYNYNPTIYDGQQGAYFQFQDKVVVESVDYPSVYYRYIGKHFAVTIVYDGNFTNFHGYARTQYNHTWSSAQITAVNFGVDGDKVKFSVGIQNSTHSFECFSNGELKF